MVGESDGDQEDVLPRTYVETRPLDIGKTFLDVKIHPLWTEMAFEVNSTVIKFS